MLHLPRRAKQNKIRQARIELRPYTCPAGHSFTAMAQHLKQEYRRRPYRVEYTGSLLTSEVKRRRARLVLGWGTAREDLRVLSAFHTHSFSHSSLKAAVGTISIEKAHLFFLLFKVVEVSSFELSVEYMHVMRCDPQRHLRSFVVFLACFSYGHA